MGLWAAHAERLPIWKSRDSKRSAQTAAARQLRVDVQLGPLPDPRSDVERRGNGRFAFRIWAQAVLAGVGRVKRRMRLRDGSELEVEIGPRLASRDRFLRAGRLLGERGYARAAEKGRRPHRQSDLCHSPQ